MLLTCKDIVYQTIFISLLIPRCSSMTTRSVDIITINFEAAPTTESPYSEKHVHDLIVDNVAKTSSGTLTPSAKNTNGEFSFTETGVTGLPQESTISNNSIEPVGHLNTNLSANLIGILDSSTDSPSTDSPLPVATPEAKVSKGIGSGIQLRQSVTDVPVIKQVQLKPKKTASLNRLQQILTLPAIQNAISHHSLIQSLVKHIQTHTTLSPENIVVVKSPMSLLPVKQAKLLMTNVDAVQNAVLPGLVRSTVHQPTEMISSNGESIPLQQMVNTESTITQKNTLGSHTENIIAPAVYKPPSLEQTYQLNVNKEKFLLNEIPVVKPGVQHNELNIKTVTATHHKDRSVDTLNTIASNIQHYPTNTVLTPGVLRNNVVDSIQKTISSLDHMPLANAATIDSNGQSFPTLYTTGPIIQHYPADAAITSEVSMNLPKVTDNTAVGLTPEEEANMLVENSAAREKLLLTNGLPIYNTAVDDFYDDYDFDGNSLHALRPKPQIPHVEDENNNNSTNNNGSNILWHDDIDLLSDLEYDPFDNMDDQDDLLNQDSLDDINEDFDYFSDITDDHWLDESNSDSRPNHSMFSSGTVNLNDNLLKSSVWENIDTKKNKTEEEDSDDDIWETESSSRIPYTVQLMGSRGINTWKNSIEEQDDDDYFHRGHFLSTPTAQHVGRNVNVFNKLKPGQNPGANLYRDSFMSLLNMYNSIMSHNVSTDEGHRQSKLNNEVALLKTYDSLIGDRRYGVKKQTPRRTQSKGNRSKQIRKLQRIKRLMEIAAKRKTEREKSSPSVRIKHRVHHVNSAVRRKGIRGIYYHSADSVRNKTSPAVSDQIRGPGGDIAYPVYGTTGSWEFDETEEEDDTDEDFLNNIFGLKRQQTFQTRNTNIYGTCPVLPVQVTESRVTVTTAEGCQIIITITAGKTNALNGKFLDINVTYNNRKIGS